jgi:DNA-binding transcriptional LysR family regulator
MNAFAPLPGKKTLAIGANERLASRLQGVVDGRFPMFELSQLRCFVATAEELHFGRAAQRLNMTQPPLSRQVQLLERILGVTLLDRTSRSVRLTPAGRAFLLEARRILRLAESAALATRRIASGDAGQIAIGFTAASGYNFLPQLVILSKARLPNADLTLREMVTREQVEALLTGRIDIGLVRPPMERAEFATARVLSEPLVAALPTGDARLAKASLTLADFDDQPLIMYSPEGAGYFYNMLTTLFDANGVTPNYVQHVTQIHSMLALVHAGLGAAIVPEAAMSLNFDDVQFRPVETTPDRPVELYMAWRKDNESPILQTFIDLCLAEASPAEPAAGGRARKTTPAPPPPEKNPERHHDPRSPRRPGWNPGDGHRSKSQRERSRRPDRRHGGGPGARAGGRRDQGLQGRAVWR